jgi:hypothetical protein
MQCGSINVVPKYLNSIIYQILNQINLVFESAK